MALRWSRDKELYSHPFDNMHTARFTHSNFNSVTLDGLLYLWFSSIMLAQTFISFSREWNKVPLLIAQLHTGDVYLTRHG